MSANGFGKPSAEISSIQKSTILKAQYAAMLLYIPSLFFSKLPTLVLLNVISPLARFRKLLIAAALLVLAWAVSSEFASAFQCRPSHTWDFVGGHCINRIAFYTYFEVMNGFTDVLLVLLPIVLLGRVNTSLRRRMHVLSVFCVRLITLGAVIAKIVLSRSEANDDPFSGTWPVAICTQLIQFLSLMSACILYLRPFLEALTSGFINGDDLRRRGQLKPYLEELSDEITLAVTGSHAHTTSGEKRSESEHGPSRKGKTVDDEEDRLETAFASHRSISLLEGTEDPGTTLRSETESDQVHDQISTVVSLPASRRPIPLGDNGLPRVSTAYSPLTKSDNIKSFLSDSSK